MLSNTQYPHLSRVYRRHPEKLRKLFDQASKGWPGGTSWLLSGLFMRAGITPRVSAEGAQV